MAVAPLAGCEPAAREALLNEIRVKTPADWTRYGPGVAAALAAWPRQGFCLVDGDLLADVQAVGVPFGRGPDGELMVFNCSFQGRRAPIGWLRDTIAPQLIALVQGLRQDLAAP
jgi:DNA-binding IclR family transcriptional regulator